MEEKSTIKEAVSLLQKGENANKGMRLLMECYREPLYYHIRRMVGAHDESADILQETFVKAYLHRAELVHIKKIDSWLYRIATNLSISILRKRKFENGEAMPPSEVPCSSTYQDGDKISLAFEQAVNRLPEKQKVVFLLRYYEEFSYKTISEITGSTIVSLKTNYHYAEKRIRQILSDEV